MKSAGKQRKGSRDLFDVSVLGGSIWIAVRRVVNVVHVGTTLSHHAFEIADDLLGDLVPEDRT